MLESIISGVDEDFLLIWIHEASTPVPLRWSGCVGTLAIARARFNNSWHDTRIPYPYQFIMSKAKALLSMYVFCLLGTLPPCNMV